jgi:endo-1,4-beta-xylanase
MEFSLSVIKTIGIVAGIFVSLLVLGAIVLVIVRRTRKAGLGILIGFFSLCAAGAVYYYFPRNFQRTYLERKTDVGGEGFRQYADALDLYIGTIGDEKNMVDPRFYRNLNSMTVENALKMYDVCPSFGPDGVPVYDFSRADAIVAAALAKNLRVRGHTLIWGKVSDVLKKPDLDKYLARFSPADRAAALGQFVDNHITRVMTRYRGKIRTWDVVNEPLESWGDGELENNVFYRYLGAGYITRAFALAHAIDPDATLFLNEIFSTYRDQRAESFYQMVKAFRENGVPVHGIGLQAHIMADTSLGGLAEYMKRLTDLGFEVELTEVDVRLMQFAFEPDPYQAQGEFYARLLGLCLQNPNCRGLTFWGFSDNDAWHDDEPLTFPKPNEPYLFDAQMNPKPAYTELYTILKNAYDARHLRVAQSKN